MKIRSAFGAAAALCLSAGLAVAQPANTNLGTLTVPGTISVPSTPVAANSVNWYSFTLAAPISACDLTWLDIDTTGADDTEVGLYDSVGNFIGTDDDDGPAALSSLSFGSGSDVTLATGTLSNGRDSRISNTFLNNNAQVLPAGTYYVAVGRFNSVFNATGWSVTSTATAGNAGVDINAGNLTPPAAPTATDLGTLGASDMRNPSFSLASTGQVQWYRIVTPLASSGAGTFLDIDTEGTVLTPTNATRIAVYNKAGRLVTADSTDGSNSLSQLTYGVTTPVRPAVGNGLTYNGRDGLLPGCEYYIAVSGSAGTSGANAFGYTSTSSNTGSVMVKINNMFPSTPPTAVVSASAAVAGGVTQLLATVTPGTSPTSSGISVTVDLSSVGGSASAMLLDDGLSGDGAANDNVFGLAYTVPGATPVATYPLTFTVSDAQSRSSTPSANLLVFTTPTVAFDFGNMSVPNCQTRVFDTTTTGEIVWFRFTLSSPVDVGMGTFLDIDTENTAGCADTEIAVYRADGTLVVSDDDDGSSLLSQISFGAATRPAPPIGPGCGTAGAAYNGRDGSLPAGTYYIPVGRFAITHGATGFNVTGTGAATTGINLNICSQPPSTPPSGVGSTIPASIPELSTATVQVVVTPGNNPASTGITVVADTSLLGGSASLTLLDDGVAPDTTANDNIFSANVATTVAAGTYAVPFTVSDAQSRTTNGTFNATVAVVTGACCAPDNSCSLLGAFDCASSGGTYQGPGTSCGGGSYAFTLGGGSPFEDISATGTDISATPGDDGSFNVALSFPFTFYGNVYNDVNVCTNGFMQFAGTSTAFGNAVIPNSAAPNNILAVLWDDFNFNQNTTDSLKHETRGTPGTDLRQIFQWTNVAQYSTTLPNVDVDFNTFQAVLFENGNIEFRYATISDQSFEQLTGAPGATVGVEDSTGSNLSAQYATGNGAASSNTSIAVAAATIPNPCAPSTGACCCGSSCTITLAAACTGANRSFAGPGTSCTPFSNTTPCCRGDYNKTGAPATVQDIFDFLAGYFSNDPCADTNDSGGAPSVQDIFDFLAAYFGGGC